MHQPLTIKNVNSCGGIARRIFNRPEFEESNVAGCSNGGRKVTIVCGSKETFNKALVGVILARQCSSNVWPNIVG